MTGGLAVRANLLCVTWSSARGHVFLFDLLARLPVSSFVLPALAGGYSDAAGVAMDDHFHLFVADPHNHRVRRFSVFGQHLLDIGAPPAAAGPAGAIGSIERDREGVLWRPLAVACGGDELWIAGGELPARRGVQRFSRTGAPQGALRSLGDPEAEFGAPRGLWVDRLGLLVADTLHGVVQRFRPDGGFVAAFACAPRSERSRPIAVVRTADHRVLVVEAGERPGVRAFAADGTPAAGGDLPSRAEQAVALTVDGQGRVYLLDRGGERVQRFGADLTFEAVLVDLAEHLDDLAARTP